MPETTYLIPEAGTLPVGFCHQDWQSTLDEFASLLRIPLPTGYAQIVMSDSEPDPVDQDKIWLKLDGSGNPIGFYLYVLGAWEQINPPNLFWGTASNTGNAYTLSVTNGPDPLVAGQTFLFTVPADNTGAATLQINALAAVAFEVAGDAMPSGALITDTVVAAVYNGTTFELIGGIQELDPSRITAGTDTQRLESSGGVAVWRGGWAQLATSSTLPVVTTGNTTIGTHGLGAVPDLVSAYLECVTTDQGYVTGDRIPLGHVITTGGDNEMSVYTPVVDATSVGFVTFVNDGVIIPNKTTGDFTAGNISGTIAKWKIVVNVFKF